MLYYASCWPGTTKRLIRINWIDIGGVQTIHRFGHQSGRGERSGGLSAAKIHDFSARVFLDRSRQWKNIKKEQKLGPDIKNTGQDIKNRCKFMKNIDVHAFLDISMYFNVSPTSLSYLCMFFIHFLHIFSDFPNFPIFLN